MIKHTLVPQHSSPEIGAETVRLVRLKKLQRRLEEIARKIFLRGEIVVSGDEEALAAWRQAVEDSAIFKAIQCPTMRP